MAITLLMALKEGITAAAKAPVVRGLAGMGSVQRVAKDDDDLLR